MRATQYVADGEIQLADAQRNAFYGLQKQAIDGDCNVPEPSRGNKTARTKYESWMKFKGMTKDAAMNRYITELQKIDSNFDGNSNSSSNLSPSFSESSSPSLSQIPETIITSTTPHIIMEGIMYKQRDVFKGWRPRYFVLDDYFLHYYIKKGDDLPRKSIQLFGSNVTVVRSTRVGDVDYYPFVISHPKSTKTYNFSVDSKELADQWIAVLKEYVTREVPAPIPNTPLDRILKRRPDEDDIKRTCTPVNPELTLSHIPEKYALKVEYAVETIIDLISTNSSNKWQPFFEKNGVTAFRRPGSVICTKGATLLPFPILDIFSLLMNDTKQKEIDMSVKSIRRIKNFSENTSLVYTRYKQIWPLTVRDFCNLVHWRLLPDGTVVIISFSEKYEDLCPLEDGIMRGELILSGYVLKQTPKGTECHYVIQTDLKGTIPSSAINLMSSIQPMNLANIKTYLESTSNTISRGSLLSRPNKPVTIQDLLFAYENSKTKTNSIVIDSPSDDTNLNRQSASGTNTGSTTETSSSATEKVRNAVKSAVDKATDIDERRKKLHDLNTVSLLVLFMPVALYYAVGSRYRGIAFIGGLLYALEYVFRLHLGIPHKKVSTQEVAAVPNGRMLVRFSVDVGRLLRYLEGRREASGVEITVTHIALKAAAVALSENPNLNGHVIGDDFYSSNSRGVDVSLTLDLMENDTVVMKIENADLKPIDYMADEIKKRKQELEDGRDFSLQRKIKLLSLLPPLLSSLLRKLLNTLGGKFGISIPLLGVVGFPHGTCTVVTIPSKEKSDSEVDIAMIPSMTDTSIPIVITIGGVRLQPIFDQDKKLAAIHVLDVAISIDTCAGSLAEGKKFASRVQQLMNTPSLLDKADRIAAVSREDEKVAAERAANHAAILKK